MLTKAKGSIRRFACVFLCMALLFLTFGIQKPILFFRAIDLIECDGVLIHTFLSCPEVTCRLYADGSITYSTKNFRRLSGEPFPTRPVPYTPRWYDSHSALLEYVVNSAFNISYSYGSKQLSDEEFEKIKDYIYKVDNGDFAGPYKLENRGFYYVYRSEKKSKIFYGFPAYNTDLADLHVELSLLAPFSVPFVYEE